MRKFFLFVAACFCLLHSLWAQSEPIIPDKIIPLVGKNCVINQIDKDLVDVFGNVSSLNNLLDTNLDNYVSLSGLAGIELAYHQIISVKDVENSYSGKDLEAGFILQSTSEGSNLLTADVLKLFVIETYLNGEKQESSVYDGAESGLLDLNLITIAEDGKTKVSIRTNKPFNEVRLAVSGVNVEAFKQLKLYYAYVGENEMKPITQTVHYPKASVHGHKTNGIASSWTSAMWNWPKQKEKLVGKNSESDGVGFGTISGLLSDPHVTINAGETIPANTEIGFMVESGSVLAIELFNNTILTTYDANDNEVESKKIVSVLGLSALSGGKTTVSMVTTKPCQQIKIQFGGLNIDLGGTKIYYAYTRDAKVEVENDCDLKLSADIAVCDQASLQLNGVSGITWSIHRQPEGANASVSASGFVSGMTKSGEYVIKAQKGNCIDYITINNSPVSQISSECNRPIVGDYVKPYAPAGGGCLLCLSPDLDDNSDNVVDTDLTNYIEYTKGLDLLSNTSIYGVQRIDGIPYSASESEPRRVGFIMQATDQFLTADVLKFFVIKTYLGDNLQESSPIDENDAVGANLIGGMSNQMRYSFVATKPFDKVTLWTAGVLSLNLSKFRIYYAFEEPAQSDCMAQYSSGSCLSLLSAQQGATINYERTGFNGVANVGASMRNLSNLIDGDMNTYAFVYKTAGIAANTTVSIKANQVFEHGYQTGFVVEEQTWLGNVDLLRFLKIKTYLNGVETGDESIKPEVLSLDLIGSYGKSLIAITPTKPFDEVVLDMSGLVDALVELKVYGAFVQPDTDGDGIPDCMDKNPCGEELIPSTAGVYCVGDQVEVSITGGDPKSDYTLQIGNETYPFTESLVSFVANIPGQFDCTIFKNGEEVYTNLPITIHPLETQWTGAISTDWNDWNNWTAGVPYTCTNVIIPSVDELVKTNGVHYPVLNKGMEYYCNGIHFKPGAELVYQNYLNYVNAWVSVNLTPEKSYMLSIPLTKTYSGDFFIPDEASALGKDLRNPFTEEIIGDVNRANPFVTCYSWNGSWKKFTGAKVLNEELKAGRAVAINAKKGSIFEDSTLLEMLFGKADTIYQYYNSVGTTSSRTENIDRDGYGQFIFPHIKGEKLNPFTVTLSTDKAQSAFAVANPFMCHIDVDSLIEANKQNISKIWINNDVENNSNASFDPSKLTELVKGKGLKIAPTISFFVETKQPTKELDLTFSEGMMVHGDYATVKQAAPQTKSKDSGNSGISLANIKAYAQNGEAVISASETITNVQIVSATGQVLANKQPNSMNVRMALAKGVNIVKVQTETDVQTFKLMNNLTNQSSQSKWAQATVPAALAAFFIS